MNEKNDRLIAYRIISQYLDTRIPLKEILNAFLDNSLSAVKRNFIYNLAKGTIKHLYFLDFGISLFSKISIKKMDPEILCILRLSAYQLMFLEKVPCYSIVDQAVKLSKILCHPKTAKFVNAVLRKMAQEKDLKACVFSRIENSGLKLENRISLAYSYPLWLVSYWQNFYGLNETERLFESLNRNPYIFLRIDPDKIKRSTAAKKLNLPEDMQPGLPESLGAVNFRVKSLRGMDSSSLFKEGKISIQDISSQIAVKYFLNPCKGESILDLCSAPGGKSIFAYELMKKEGNLVSVDINRGKIAKMKDNFHRMGMDGIQIIMDDAASLQKLGKHVLFDKIFIDAPCSALGTISKNPDVKYNKKKEDINRLASNSFKILARAAEFIKKGGKIIYYTCTLSPIENQQMIEKFVGLNADFSIYDRIPPELKNLISGGCTEIKPYYFGSEGGFVCTLIKKA